MINKDLKTLKEIQSNLMYINEVFESVRKKLSKFDVDSLQTAQEHVVLAINALKYGIKNVEQGITTEQSKLDEMKETTDGTETTR